MKIEYFYGIPSPFAYLGSTKLQSIGDRIVDCSIGKFSYTAIDDKGMVWIWGDNKHAQLGLSDYTPRQTPYPLLPLKDKNIDSIHFGSNFAIALNRMPKLQEESQFIQYVASPHTAMVSNSSKNLLQQTPLF